LYIIRCFKLFTSGPKIAENADPDDSDWIGCWWLGYQIGAILCLLSGLSIVVLPKEHHGTLIVFVKFILYQVNILFKYIIVNLEPGEEEVIEIGAMEKLKKLPSAFFELFSNIRFILIILAGSCEIALMAGIVSFLPKLLEHQFSLGKFDIAIMMGKETSYYFLRNCFIDQPKGIPGSIIIPGGLIGVILGGFVAKYIGDNINGLLKFAVVTLAISSLCIPAMLIYCTGDNRVGFTIPYDENKMKQK
jgi:organic anion transporter 4A